MAKDTNGNFNGPTSLAEAGLLQRLVEMARFSRFDPDEASDQAKSAVRGATQYLETKAPEADVLIVAAVPFREKDGRIGNAMAQEVKGGRHFGISMREDVLPQQARFFCDGGWKGFGQRLKLCLRILFGKSPAKYERTQ